MMTASRREFLKGIGALVVSFGAGSAWEPRAGGVLTAQEKAAQEEDGQFGTQASHIDPQNLDSWLAIASDGMVTAFTGKCDFGQGMLTAQTQLIAEELCVPMERVKLVMCDTALTPDQGSTSGSQSTPTNFNDENLALAAATAREALLGLAAGKLGQPVESLTVRAGVITARSGRSVPYGDLLKGQHFNLGLSRTAKRRTPEQWTVLGKPVPSLDQTALMTGQFEFLQYLGVPGMLHGRPVRPPEMGATLQSVDETSVRGLPGLVKVVVRENYVGVVAEKPYQAIVAARELKVKWAPGPGLPAQKGFFDGMRGQPSEKSLAVDSGNVDAKLAAAHEVVEARYLYPFQMHGSVGTSCAVADVRTEGVTVWSSTQSAYPTRSCVALLLNRPVEDVRVIYVRGSGCYGLNGADAVSFDAAILSAATGRPVRAQFSREDEMAWENLGSAVAVQHRVGLDAGGAIVAWDRENWVAERGERPGYDRPGNVISGHLVGFEPKPLTPGPAKLADKFGNQSNAVPEYLLGCVGDACGGGGTVASERVLTHTVRSPFFTGSLRSPIRIQNTFANECFMDELAARAGADPVAYRLRHLRSERTVGVLTAVAGAASWQPQAARSKPAGEGGKEIAGGRGVACVAYEGRNGYSALVAYVTVDLATGVVRPTRFVVAIDCGPISNPDGLANQIEGGILQGTSRALVEEVTWDERRITSSDWTTYKSLYLSFEVPPIEIVHVTPTGVPASGAGETAITVTPAALGNAIFDATGARLRELPFTPERVLAALHAARAEGNGGRA